MIKKCYSSRTAWNCLETFHVTPLSCLHWRSIDEQVQTVVRPRDRQWGFVHSSWRSSLISGSPNIQSTFTYTDQLFRNTCGHRPVCKVELRFFNTRKIPLQCHKPFRLPVIIAASRWRLIVMVDTNVEFFKKEGTHFHSSCRRFYFNKSTSLSHYLGCHFPRRSISKGKAFRRPHRLNVRTVLWAVLWSSTVVYV